MTTEAGTMPERVATLEEIVKHLATKEDISDLKVEISDVKAEISNLRVEISDLKVEISDLRVDIARGQVNSIRWTVGAMFAIATLAVAAIKLL